MNARQLGARAPEGAPVHNSRAPEGAPVRKARDVEVAARASVRELARAAIAEGRAHFLHNVAALPGAHEPERVHQTRVALRRLRVFVRLFRSRIGRQRAARLAGELRWLFQLLGELRDLQLFERDYAPLGRAHPAGSGAFGARVRRRLASAARTLDEALASPRFRALCEELASVEDELAAPASDKGARRWLARRLDRRRRGALRCFEAVLRKDVPELHRLRKELKKLRYTAELARALRPARKQKARAFLHALRDLQEVLGALVDADVARALLERVGAPHALQARLNPRIARRSAAKLAALEPTFQHFADTSPFWR